MGISVTEEIRFGLRWGLIIGGSVAALIALSYLASTWAGISLFSLYRNFGPISDAAVLVLASGGVAAWFAASLLPAAGRRSMRGFLFWMGALGLLLAFDDLYGLHDPILPRRLGIDESFIFLGYGIALLLIIGYFRAVAGSSHISLLVLGGASMVVSAALDLAKGTVALPRLVEVAEDPAKFAAWVFLSVYLIWTARDAVLTKDHPPLGDEAPMPAMHAVAPGRIGERAPDLG